jgi:uncharacterized protein (TIGR00730 family)
MEMQIVAVFGAGTVQPGTEDYEQAYRVGQALGKAGFTIITGGYGGVMEATSKGAAEAGAHVVGVTTAQFDADPHRKANVWVHEEIKLPTARDRLLNLVQHADAYVVMPGGIGTLAELATVWEFMRVGDMPFKLVICYGDLWRRTMQAFVASPYVGERHAHHTHFADTPEQVVAILQEAGKG